MSESRRSNVASLDEEHLPDAGMIEAPAARASFVVAHSKFAHLPTTTVAPYLTSMRKRLLDLVVSAPLALVTAPVVLVLAIGSLLSFRAWPFFCQTRVGMGGHEFRMWKVRSLPVDAPQYASKYTVQRLGTTRFGAFLRKTHLDELPQLALVCLGRMSLVGPRPEMRVLSDSFGDDFVALRTSVRPGCAGLWQVSGDADRLIGEVPQYDLVYLTHATLLVDLQIAWRTLSVMAGRGPTVLPPGLDEALVVANPAVPVMASVN